MIMGTFKYIFTDVYNDIKDKLLEKQGYNVSDFYWYIQDCLKMQQKNHKEYFINNDILNIIKNISFEWGTKEACILFAKHFIENIDKYETLYEVLSNQDSKSILKWLIKSKIAYMFCGDIYKELYAPPNSIIMIDESKLVPNYQSVFFVGKHKIYCHEHEIYDTWIREQYKLKGICEPQVNDIVFSIGSFYGETSIWFSDIVGSKGKVFGFEASEENTRVANANLLKNNITNVVIDNVCLWESSKKLHFHQKFGESKISQSEEDIEICAISLDEYCKNNNIEKINFIKMDVEGAEISILLGAEETIKTFKPKLAICVYHQPSDLVDIPILLKKYVPEYKIYLSHKRPDFLETVIFATL